MDKTRQRLFLFSTEDAHAHGDENGSENELIKQ
jgi:hypothetical protein